VLATAPADGGGPAAALPWAGETIVARLLDQLATLGVRRAIVITRDEWEADVERAVANPGLQVRVRRSPGLAADLTAVGEIARETAEPLVVLEGDVVTHREALAGLLSDPRVVTGALSKFGSARGLWFATRSSRGRVLAAASPYHAAARGNGSFLGVLKVDPRDRVVLIETAERLAELAEPPVPAGWEEELARKEGLWRVRLARQALRAANGDEEEEPVELDPETVVLSEEDEREVRRRLVAAPTDAASLLLVGLVRGGVHVTNSHLRGFFWARPLSRQAAEEAERIIGDYDEESVLLGSAVKANDGFFTTFFVSPYSKYIARWAARWGWTPNAVTTFSMGLGVLSAVAFAMGGRAGLIAGAVLLQVAFTFDCVDGQLARYTRTFSKLGAWLDSIFDRTKEYLVFAGLAIGSAHALGDDVWVLAAAALTLQTTRHSLDFAFAATQHRTMATTRHPPLEEPGYGDTPRPGTPATPPAVAAEGEPQGPDAELPRPPLTPRELARRALGVWRILDRRSWTRWPRKVIAFPIGERFAVVSLTAALFTPRTTFTVLLVWGGVAFAYATTGRVLRSLAR
jgi:phosphatidylglycerophosphate synthase